MTSVKFEAYRFLRLYSIDLDTAAKALVIVRRYKKGDVQVALLRDLAVTYARPFSENRGIEIPRDRLSIRHVPRAARALHKDLLDLRNTQFAHTDLKFHNPRVAQFGTASKPWYPMSFKSFDYRALLRRLPEIAALIKSVESSVKTAIQRYEAQF